SGLPWRERRKCSPAATEAGGGDAAPRALSPARHREGRRQCVVDALEPVVAPTPEHEDRRALALATSAFFICVYAWALLGPLAPGLKQQVHLDEVQVGWMVAVPVVMGSLMRIPMGALTDRWGARRIFPALMVFSALPLIALAIWHEAFWQLVVFGFL